MSLKNFIQYNNAVPIAVSVVFLGAGGVFAATNPEVIYSEQETVVAVDNTYLVSKDLGSYSPSAEITGVTEDNENYYVTYVLHTIDLEDYVWQDVVREKSMTVSKALLGQYGDLGLYVAKQLGENIAAEERRLADTQAIERTQISQKIVATQYGGLVGKMLDTSTEILPGYVPVVAPPPPPPETQVAAASGSGGQTAPTNVPAEPGAPTIQILGNNPASLSVGASYADLGAVITGPTEGDRNLGIKVFVNDAEVSQPTIDSSSAGTWFIRYEAINAAGKRGSAERVVIVTDPNAPAPTGGGGDATPSDTDSGEGISTSTPEQPTEEPTESEGTDEVVTASTTPQESVPTNDEPQAPQENESTEVATSTSS